MNIVRSPVTIRTRIQQVATLLEMEEIRRRLGQEGQDRIDAWFESEECKKERMLEDRAQRAAARRALSILEKKRTHREMGRRKKG